MSLLHNPLLTERILNLAFNSFFILLLAWILTRLFQQKAAPIRSGIILAAIFILLLLPLLNSPFLIPGIPSITTVLPIALPDASHNSNKIRGQLPTRTDDTLPASSVSLTSPENSVPNFRPPTTSDQSGPRFIKITNSLGMIWILGFFILSIKLIFGILSLRKFKNGLEEIHDKRILNLLETAERSFTNHPRASIFTSRKITSPLALGISKPLIILPHGLYKKLKDNEIRGILLHELSHVYHRDHISGILQRLASALHWWNPIVYALSADLSRAREEVSDNHVLLENDKKEYAECLINLAERMALISRLPVTTGMASPHFPLKDRVKNILSKERRMETQLKKSTIWMIVLVSLFILGTIGGHRLTFASADKTVIEGLHAEDKAEVRHITDPYPSANPEPATEAAASPVLQEKTETADKQKTKERKIVKPKLVKKVDPVYPDEAKEAGVEGAVVVEGITDENGKVIDAKILKGAHEILNKAAVAAVKQWEYKPFVINGKQMPVEFTTTIRFRLDEKDKALTKSETTTAGADADVITLPDDVELQLLKKVEPKYPVEARKKLLGGVILLEAIIDKQGNVLDVKVVEGEHEILNAAAIEAVKQWKYEPYNKEGQALKVRYKIELKFHVK